MDLTKPLVHWQTRAPVTILAGTTEDVTSAAEREYRETNINKWRLFASKIEHGHKCFIAKNGFSVVGYNWIAFGSFWSGIDFIVLGENEVWCSDAYTAIDWRGQGIHTALLAAMIEWARKEKYKTAYTHVSVFHPRSWKAHERLKWHVSGLYFGIHLPRLEKQLSLAVYGSRYPIRHTIFRSQKSRRPQAIINSD